MTDLGKKRTGASKASRHTKKYWRKGTDIASIEDSIVEAAETARTVDDNAIFVDKTPTVEQKKYTKRQQAVLDRISRTIVDDDSGFPKAKAPAKSSIKKLRQPVTKRAEPIVKLTKKRKYDVWEKDFEPHVDLSVEEAAEHLLKYTKKKLPKVPGTMKAPVSLLPAVIPINEGASYNPTLVSYTEYVSKLVEDEQKIMDKEKKIEQGRKPQYESVVTHAERHLELTEGLVIDPRYDKEDEETETPNQPAESFTAPTVENNRKTKKQRETAKKEVRKLREQKRRKAVEKGQHDVFKAKSINKTLAVQEEEINKKAVQRRKDKIIKKMTTAGKLSSGTFEEEDEPFLLQEELMGSMRQMKPQGNVLTDRMKSLQKRNMLPVLSVNKSKKRKTRLRVKLHEKRVVSEIKQGTKLR